MHEIRREEKEHLERLIQAIQLLAADYETQIGILPDFVHIPDELALTYGDCFLFADDIAEAGLIEEEVLVRLKELDDTFEHLSRKGNEAFWTLSRLRDSDEWQCIRSMASKLLVVLGRQKQHPDLYWISYIKGSSDST